MGSDDHIKTPYFMINKTALDDCNFFLENFSDSLYYSRVYYQKGKLLYQLGEFEKSVVVLSDFCHNYTEDELYSHALFYIGESLFAFELWNFL